MLQSGQKQFISYDGTYLFYRKWTPLNGIAGKAVIYLHDWNETSHGFEEFIQHSGLYDFAHFAHDMRGQGYSPGVRGYAESTQQLVKDLESFVIHISRTYDIPMERIVLVSNRMSTIVAKVWLMDYSPRLMGMIFMSSISDWKNLRPFEVPFLKFLNSFFELEYLNINLNSKNSFLDLLQFNKRKQMGDIFIPLLVDLIENSERITKSSTLPYVRTEELSPAVNIDQKTNLKTHILKIKNFIDDCLKTSRLESKATALTVDRSLVRKLENKNILTKISERLVHEFSMIFIDYVGKLSKGIQYSFEFGIHSPVTQNHICGNRPEGRFWIGQIIDYFFLNTKRAKVIRTRHLNMKKLIENAIQYLYVQQQTIRILDFSSGLCGYLLEVINKNPKYNIRANIARFQQDELDQIGRLAFSYQLQDLQMQKVENFESNFHPIVKNPNIIIINDLLENYLNREKIAEVIRQISMTADQNALLIYSCNPGGEVTDYISKTANFGKESYKRSRNQYEVDSLLKEAGFQRTILEVDNQGVFAVAVAQKRYLNNYELAPTLKSFPSRESRISMN